VLVKIPGSFEICLKSLKMKSNFRNTLSADFYPIRTNILTNTISYLSIYQDCEAWKTYTT